MKNNYRFILAGGGTGGHLFPGIAFANYLKENLPNVEILFIGTQRGIEVEKVPASNFNLELIDIGGIKGMSKKDRFNNLLKIPKSILKSKKIINAFAPDAVIGLGGYASGPALIAAWMERYPTFIFEQNSIPGITNRILSKFVKNIFTTFEYSHRFFKKEKIVFSGNPVRKAIREMSIQKTNNDVKNILVFGGSQGAKKINEIIAEASPKLTDFNIIHQTGKYTYDKTKELYSKYSPDSTNITLTTFIEDMAKAYNDADLVICRSGATTISELKIIKKPSILIPFPQATDNHQVLNAQELVNTNSAIMIEEKDLTSDFLVKTIMELKNNNKKYLEMKDSFNNIPRVKTEETILNKILEYINI
jgi:UDP-N-acetylglucosamine--N-acetylmuramyl-(pentapeptide) pyrophosphoryl-undecaprenol N-acetylglucosamine transferase